jgi:predicted MPP superfamily phosphohydrolase
MITEKDFSHLTRFPGETGNILDVVLHKFQVVESIPAILFGGLLLLMATLASHLVWARFLVLWGFFLLDWLLVSLLPHFQRSYGPAKPPVLILALMRGIIAFVLPFPLSLVFQGIGTLLVVYAFWIEPHRLGVTTQKITTPKIPTGARLRILHLGDLHVERITHRERLLQEKIDILQPDLIVFSGDILNLSFRTDPTAIEHARQIIGKWKAPLGVYLVSGSPAVDLPEMLPVILKDLPIHWLKADRETITFQQGKLDLVGLTCTHRPNIDGENLKSLIPRTPDNFTLLVYHSPDLAPVAAKLGVDLQVSGHTHGGQVRIPGFGALVTGSLYGKLFEMGRIAVGSMVLYVTRGIGLEGAAAPRVRLFCPPEIILWEIEGSGNPSSSGDNL